MRNEREKTKVFDSSNASTGKPLSSSFLDSLATFFEGRGAFLFLIPALILIGIFVVFPVVWDVYVSMTNASLVGPSARHYSFVGLYNYVRLFRDFLFINSLKVSFAFTVLSALIGQAFLGLALAMISRMEGIRGKMIVTTIVFIAWVIPGVVSGYAWSAVTAQQGLVASILSLFGYRVKYALYFTHPFWVIVIANIWRGTAFSMILFTAALEGIPRYIYEAAEVDGATPWQRFRHVILPLISQAILVDFILITIWTFGVFALPYMILGPGGGRGNAGQIWTLYIYFKAIDNFDIALAAAASDVMFVIVLALIIGYLWSMKHFRRW